MRKIVEVCEQHGISLSLNQAEVLKNFCDFLLKKNEEFNLTAVTSIDEIIIKHLVDSLMVEKLVEINLKVKFLDVGAGAGFPSVPIAVKRPDLKMFQLDCLNKRVVFLNEVAKLFNLNMKANHGRAEEFGKKANFREKFKFVTARAVAPLNKLLEYCMPFVEVGGYFIALKGRNFEAEMEQASKAVLTLGGKFESLKEYMLGNDVKRVLLLIKKISQTPTKYPRINSQILKNAL